MKTKKEKTRLQFDFSEDAIGRLDQLVKDTDSASRAEVIRNALRVYEYLVNQKREGYEVNIVRTGAV